MSLPQKRSDMAKMKQEDRDRLFAAIDANARNRYHQIYIDLGYEQSRNGNFHCPNPNVHSDGKDDNASLSVNNETGQYRCHCCGIKGNLATFYKEFIAGSGNDRWDGHYTKLMADILHLNHLIDENGNISSANLAQLRALDADKLVSGSVDDNGTAIQNESVPMQKKAAIQYVPSIKNDDFVNQLTGSPELMSYLKEMRNIDEKTILTYRIGYSNKDNAFTFPMIDAMGRIQNIKLYRPWKSATLKWQAYIKDNGGMFPTPLIHLTHSKIYIFEGEPDVYMAAAHGIYGITSGSASNYDYKKLFGEQFNNIFRNKEIVVVCDSDKAGEVASASIARQMIEVAKQVKILRLDKAEINPHGLDPSRVHDVKGKLKRVEKDVTDFFNKNGFGEVATKRFRELEDATPVYTSDSSRSIKQKFKVKLSESMNSRYYDNAGNISLDMMANVSESDENVYKYPTRIGVECDPLKDVALKNNMLCKLCKISGVDQFGSHPVGIVNFDLVLESQRKAMGAYEIPIKEYDILQTIQAPEKSRDLVRKKILKIPRRCECVVFHEIEQKSVQRVTLTEDVEERTESTIDSMSMSKVNARHNISNKHAQVQAYFGSESLVDEGVNVNKSYRMNAIQTRSPQDQKTVIFCHDIKPEQDSFERFKMTPETAEMLKVFRPQPGQSIGEALAEKYKVFGSAAGINGREDVFMLCDLAYFSCVELNLKNILPQVSRGWVEVLIAGDTRCGKSIASEFLYKHYRIGEYIGGTKSITKTGLIGGITQQFQKHKISWGVLPQNDRGMVTIDELSRISLPDLDTLTEPRGSGLVDIEMIVRGKTLARVRKIFLSNWREMTEGDVNRHDYGLSNIKKLCGADAVLSRFDAALVVKNTDVLNFDVNYEAATTKYTSYQCRQLIAWAYSRTTDQFVYEEGFAKALNDAQELMFKNYHPSSQLVNQEMRAKIARLATALATEQFSTPEGDYEKVLVKVEHAQFMANELMRIYGPKSNIGIWEYSQEMWRRENLGDMKFMMNVLKYVDIDHLLSWKEGTAKDMSHLFADYLLRVTTGKLWMVDGNSDFKSSNWKSYEALDKFIGVLLARNAFTKVRNAYRKTDVFAAWLSQRKEQGDAAPTSDILENAAIDPGFGGSFVPEDLVKRH